MWSVLSIARNWCRPAEGTSASEDLGKVTLGRNGSITEEQPHCLESLGVLLCLLLGKVREHKLIDLFVGCVVEKHQDLGCGAGACEHHP